MSVQLLAHRGLWLTPDEKNSPDALQRALRSGLGIETDVRDLHQQLVIAHDPPGANAWPLRELLEFYREWDCQAPLALNIKADGLAPALASMLQDYGITNYFVFDMSVPDTRQHARLGLRFFSRQSEWEPQPILYQSCSGVWIDTFETLWYDSQLIADHVSSRKEVCLVSPELHGRSHRPLWEMLHSLDDNITRHVLLCTDYPYQF